MAFDELTPSQAETLTQLIKALSTGNYSDEFVTFWRAGYSMGHIQLYGKEGVSDREIDGFTSSGLEVLREQGYLTITSKGRGSLKQKAYQQYESLGMHIERDSVEVELNMSRNPSIDIFTLIAS
jgi:hypothetical protein